MAGTPLGLDRLLPITWPREPAGPSTMTIEEVLRAVAQRPVGPAHQAVVERELARLVARPPASRQEALKDAVVEAARQVMFWHLRDERLNQRVGATLAPCLEFIEALQTLRDAAAAERRARSGR